MKRHRSRRPARRRTCTRCSARWRTGPATCRCCGRNSRRTRRNCSCPGAASVPGRSPRRVRWRPPPCPDHLASSRPDHALTPQERRRIFGFLVGSDGAEHWEGFLSEELALEGTDPRRPSWRTADLGRDFRCAVIGAGASGLAAAHRLRQAGVAVTVFEKNGDVGGTWLENVYPGCRVDVPNQLYSFSFAQTNDWVSRFSAQPDLLAYLQSTAKDLGLGECIRFRSEVTEARFDEAAAEWSLTVRGADGTETTEVVDGIVCAVGQLNRPSFPAILGQDRFTGPSFHSAAWDDTVELADRARCRHRERCQCGAVRAPPGGGGRPPRRLPAHRALVAPDGQLRQPVPAGVPRAAAVASGLRALGPAVAVLASARGATRGGPGRPRAGTSTPKR